MGDVGGRYDLYAAFGLVVALPLLAVGTVGLVVPVSQVMPPEEAEHMFRFGLRCAGALGLLMVFELIAYVRRPSSFPRARVTHGL